MIFINGANIHPKKQILPNDFIREEKNGIAAVIDCFDLSPIEELLNINTD